MVQEKKIHHVIIDTSAFIKNTALQEIGINIITEENVINEITSKRQLKRLVVLPYDLNVKQAFPEDVKIVTEFAKKTGDYTSLSATDIKVIALTYRLHIENIGTDKIKVEPEIPKIGDFKNHSDENLPNIAGFYNPKSKDADSKENVNMLKNNDEKIKQMLNEINIYSDESSDETSDYYDCSDSLDIEREKLNCETGLENNCYNDSLAENLVSLDINTSNFKADSKKDEDLIDMLLLIENEEEPKSENKMNKNNDTDDDNDDGDEGWITPQNIYTVKKDMTSNIVEDESVPVACLTMDFAMQNVLMQMGLQVATLEGKVIKQLRTFILRCYACYRTTSLITKIFCPYCGMKTLKKVSIALNKNGELQMFINYKKPLSARGKRFSLPTPKGGKHSNNPILREDQPMPDQKPSKLARQKNDPLNDDWIAGYSPFVTRDITSRSAMLGIRPGSDVKYWMRRNPNEIKRTGKKGKK